MTSAVILGGARCLWDDIKHAPLISSKIITVNYSSLFYPKVHIIFSMHPAFLELFRRMRFLRYTDQFCETWSNGHFNGVDRVFDVPNGGGGCLGAVYAAMETFDQIHLCGSPLDASGNFYDPTPVNESFTKKRKVWDKLAPEMRGRVVSYSGYTRELLGEKFRP